MNQKKNFKLETELANFVLSEFIDPLAGASKYNDIPIPYNFNEVLNHIYSKSSVFEHPFSFTKSKLENHLFQKETHYYRSKRDGIHKEGYGGHDEEILSILSTYLGIKKEAYKKYDYAQLKVLLLKFDHDGHNDEKDSSKVQDWLISEYFGDTYKEPSTSLSGDHGYIKLAYPSNLSIEYVCSVIKEVFALLDKKRKQLGFCSPIDVPCGLPNLISWDNSISIDTQMPKITYKEYNHYRNIKKSIITGEIPESNAQSLRISNRYIFSDINMILSMPLPCTIKQSQCGKVPRFITKESPYHPSVDNIISFFHLRYFHFNHFMELLNSLTEELGELPYQSEQGDLSRCHSINTPCLVPSLDNPVSIEREEEVVVCNIVRPPCGDRVLKEEEYLKIIETKIKYIVNNAARVNSLYYHYSEYLGYIPSEEDAEKEYLRLGLNKSESPEGRQRRFHNARIWVESVKRTKGKGFTPQEWEKYKDRMIKIVEENIDPEDKYWFKGKKKYYLKSEELALIYYAILKSNEIDDKKKVNNTNKYAFSYKQVQDVFRTVYQKGCHRDKIFSIFKLLKNSELIESVGEYEPGKHGNKYKACNKHSQVVPVAIK
jgi:hypothetical protein